MTVLLDTNALMMPVECNVRLFDELERVLDDTECVVPAAVVDELEKLQDGAGEEATAASVGRDLADRCAVEETAADYADDAVVELARTGEFSHVVTNDEPLQARLRAESVPVIGLRGGNKLAITQ
ncbi:PIN domain-containing protein [Halobacteriales archaeon Cl-PHB]